jgi:hypothetical protein
VYHAESTAKDDEGDVNFLAVVAHRVLTEEFGTDPGLLVSKKAFDHPTLSGARYGAEYMAGTEASLDPGGRYCSDGQIRDKIDPSTRRICSELINVDGKEIKNKLTEYSAAS